MSPSSEEPSSKSQRRYAKAAWRNARELSREFLGCDADIGQAMRRLQGELVEDLKAQGFAEEEAEELVNDHLIGRRELPGRPGATAASPDAVRLLGLKLRENAAPRKPAGWQSAIELSKSHQHSYVTIENRLEEFRAELIACCRAAGMEEGEALQQVGEHFISRRKPPTGQESLAASPAAVLLAVVLGVLEPRKRSQAHSRS